MPAEYHANVAVAALDVLGVKNLLSREDHAVAAADVLGRFVRNASSRGIFNREDLTARHADMFADDTDFGDSLYLFARSDDSIETQVQWLLVRVATLIGVGLWTAPTFMVRAAIATGDLRTRVVQSDGAPHEMRIGTAMVRAHVLQDGQQWIGGAVYPGVPINAEASKWLASAVVPVKDSGLFPARPTAINWIWSNATVASVEEYATAASRSVPGKSDDREKLANTIAFIRATFHAREFAPYKAP